MRTFQSVMGRSTLLRRAASCSTQSGHFPLRLRRFCARVIGRGIEPSRGGQPATVSAVFLCPKSGSLWPGGLVIQDPKGKYQGLSFSGSILPAAPCGVCSTSK